MSNLTGLHECHCQLLFQSITSEQGISLSKALGLASVITALFVLMFKAEYPTSTLLTCEPENGSNSQTCQSPTDDHGFAMNIVGECVRLLGLGGIY